MEQALVVGVDGSDASLRALDWAVDEAVRRGVDLRVVCGSSWEWYEGHEPSFDINRRVVQKFADRMVDRAVERAMRRTVAVKVTGQVAPADPAAALITESRRAGAVIVGNRGRGELAGLLVGSVSLAVAAHAECPVIVVRGTEQSRNGAFGRVVVGVDEAKDAAPALEFAFRAAKRRDAHLLAVHAWRCPAHELPDHPIAEDAVESHRLRAQGELTQALRNMGDAHHDPAVRGEVVEGRARTALLDAAKTADLLVVGARRRKGHVGMQLGPVNHAVLHHATCPVAIVPHA
ncbi:universal stress protein [Streptomyces indicus]|uniref:Nucleotide-binding universal stress protein, UspA family n=1 Tax=Streptomyces indicus TaxID=417292 RepID=A0A1G8ZVE0_9ACTN|nr:universal stress protein [Streptomyces indicus]SDK18961.1 Nucleotide-binding universal stress protein, UspA family [Streptomyces indicus]